MIASSRQQHVARWMFASSIFYVPPPKGSVSGGSASAVPTVLATIVVDPPVVSSQLHSTSKCLGALARVWAQLRPRSQVLLATHSFMITVIDASIRARLTPSSVPQTSTYVL
eukprot:5612597-Pleurochrysis_carterae.AAC.1